jgi:hypothetical protein
MNLLRIKREIGSELEPIPLFLTYFIQGVLQSIPLRVAARPRFVTGGKVCARFTDGGNILSSGSFQNIFCFRSPIGIVAMDRKQYAAFSYTSLVSFCFVFGNTRADQCSHQSTRRATDSGSCQCGHNRSGGRNGPTPGRAIEPTPANQPNTPPTTAPEPAPVAAPSGAFVPFS